MIEITETKKPVIESYESPIKIPKKKTKRKNVSETSVISYSNILSELGSRQLEVLLCLKKLKVANNTMILKEMNKKYPKMQISSITGRLNEIREKQNPKNPIIRLHHTGACPETGHTTNFYCLVSYFDNFLD